MTRKTSARQRSGRERIPSIRGNMRTPATPAIVAELMEGRILFSTTVTAVTLDGTVAVKAGVVPPTQSMLSSVSVKFSDSVTVNPAALSLRNLTAGSAVASSQERLAYDSASHTATWTFPTLVGNGPELTIN